jgi:hypothetical protein
VQVFGNNASAGKKKQDLIFHPGNPGIDESVVSEDLSELNNDINTVGGSHQGTASVPQMNPNANLGNLDK